MKQIAFFAVLGLLSWGTPAFAQTNPDFDGDAIGDEADNCSEVINPMQDDTDLDDCGNLCDADYDNDGAVDFGDFGYFTSKCFGTRNAVCDHTEPIGDTVGLADFPFVTSNFGAVPGPSGTTAGTTACPQRLIGGK